MTAGPGPRVQAVVEVPMADVVDLYRHGSSSRLSYGALGPHVRVNVDSGAGASYGDGDAALINLARHVGAAGGTVQIVGGDWVRLEPLAARMQAAANDAYRAEQTAPAPRTSQWPPSPPTRPISPETTQWIRDRALAHQARHRQEKDQ